jgi:hypothetical protein
MSIEERERQIAAARQAHPVQLNPSMKPRLEYILEGKAPPPQKPEDQAQKHGDASTTVTE